MKRFLVLPHADFTLRQAPPPSHALWDGSHAFISRLLAPGTMEAFVPPDADGALRAKAACLLRDSPGQLTRLRALQTFLQTATTNAPVELRVDDLELATGSTECLRDVEAAASHPLPFAPELEQALALVREADAVRIWLGQDQQLLALLWLLHRWPAQTALELEGPFAERHRAALAQHPGLTRARWVFRPGAMHIQSWDGSSGTEPLRWCQRDEVPHESTAWAGPCALPALLQPETLERTGCHVAVFRFASLAERCISSDGDICERATLEASLASLQQRRIRVVGEWWVGAPGVSLEAHEETARVLEQGFPLTALGGVRRFHWTKGRPGASFAGTHLTFQAPPKERELARTLPFEASGTLPSATVEQLLSTLPRRLSQQQPLAPGRLAGAYCEMARMTFSKERLVRDADCAIVDLPVALDGKPGPAWYSLNLRTGDTLKLDGRLAPVLSALTTPTSPSAVLPQMPAGPRTALIETLTRKHVLQWV